MSTLVESEKLPTAELVAAPRAEADDDDDAWSKYRPLSMLAVMSLVVSLVSLVAVANVLLVGFSIIATLLAWWAWRNANTYRDEVRGAGIALAALLIGLTSTAGGVGAYAYEYITELPDGYERLGFQKLQPDERNYEAWQERLKALDGKKVFIKGYALAGNQKKGIVNFILCADQGDCCFGGNPKITDRVLIQLTNTEGIDYSDYLQKFTGTFHYRPTKNAIDVSNGGDVWYILEGAGKR